MFLMILATRIQTSITSSVSRNISAKGLDAGPSGITTLIHFVQAFMTLGKSHHMSHVPNNLMLRKFEVPLQSKFHLHSSPRLINKETGCYKPCSYRKYNLIGDHQQPPTNINFTDGFMLWSFTDDILVGKTNDIIVYQWLHFV